MAKGQIPPGLAAFLAKNKGGGNPNNREPSPLMVAAKNRLNTKVVGKSKKKPAKKAVMVPDTDMDGE